MIMTKDKVKLASAAMAVDCEGCICISRTRLKTSAGNEYFGYDCKVSIANNSMKLMRWLVRYFGGDFRPKQKGKLGKKQCYEWFCSGGHKKIELFLLGIIPYLLIKREQAELALEYVRMDCRPNPERRSQLWENMKVLHQYDDVESPTTNMSSIGSDAVKIEPELHGDMQSVPVVTQTT